MEGPLERRLTVALSNLTLRKAVSVIVVVATFLERLIDPAFNTFGQALWWAVSTVSTVGDGDYVPESAAGRLIGSVLMLTGLALIPIITSVVVSILVSQRTSEARAQELSDIERILERLDKLDQRLAGLESR